MGLSTTSAHTAAVMSIAATVNRTVDQVPVASVMRLLERMTKGTGSRFMLFKTFPPFTSFEKPLPPTGCMLTEDWQRVGHPPFNFLTS